MNEDNAVDTSCCASCGIAEVDDIKLKECAGCDLVRYCSDGCQKNHSTYHKEACKKRAAELRDKLLFKQPESTHLGDCPICMIPLSLDVTKSPIMLCCSTIICNGCDHANQKREVEQRLRHACPFCREPLLYKEEYDRKTMKRIEDKRRMKRIEANDPVAMTQWGGEQHRKGNYSSAFEHYTKAAELGEIEAHCRLAEMYYDGHGVEKEKGKEKYHLEEAAIGGHPDARYNLGWNEWNNGNTEKAVQHFIIAATQGNDLSIKLLMSAFKVGKVSKEDLAAALRAHKAALDATKSQQRAAAEEYRRKWSSAN
eukprot:scaffold12988_cov91-Skeletonema_dohrnii-CCMP3373.AAC.1